jgi:hypothetical protein
MSEAHKFWGQSASSRNIGKLKCLQFGEVSDAVNEIVADQSVLVLGDM